MKKKVLSWLGRLLYNRNEYVYVFSLPLLSNNTVDVSINEDSLKEAYKKATALASKNEHSATLQKQRILSFIKEDLKSKKIEFADFIPDYPNNLTYYIVASDAPNNFFLPLFYEIMAFTKLKDTAKFTHKYKTLLFNSETHILKFRVRCYGKKS